MKISWVQHSAAANADYAGSVSASLRRDKQFSLRVSGWRKSPTRLSFCPLGGFAMRVLFPISALMLSLSMTGCIQGPSTDMRSPEVSGRIIDIKSQQPLRGVAVVLHDHPAVATTSDADGHFTLRGTKNFHLFTLLGVCSTSFPEGKYYHDTLDVTNAGYAPLSISARQYLPAGVTNVDSGHLTLRDVQVTPIDR